jgi:hypothetical protein
MHGGAPGSGGPKGSRNGNYKHGPLHCRGDRLSQVAEATNKGPNLARPEPQITKLSAISWKLAKRAEERSAGASRS